MKIQARLQSVIRHMSTSTRLRAEKRMCSGSVNNVIVKSGEADEDLVVPDTHFSG